MAGVGGRVRKQWKVQDGPQGTLRRLRSQLAEDGCSESQVVLAKHLLKEAAGDTAHADEQLAVAWLLKAAEQDHPEAIHLLHQCFANRKGITPQNHNLVVQCLMVHKHDHISAGRDTQRIKSRLSSIRRVVGTDDCGSTGEAEVDAGLSSSGSEASGEMQFLGDNGHVYTEEDLLQAANESTAGTGTHPRKSMDRLLSKQYYAHLSLYQKVLHEPLLTLKMSYFSYLEWLSTTGPSILHFMLVPGRQHLVILFLLHWAVPFDVALEFLPFLIFCMALFCMMVSTAAMLGSCRGIYDVNQWKVFLNLHNCEQRVADDACGGSKFRWYTAWPYVYFFGALFILLLVYPLCYGQWVPTGECTMIAAVFTVVTVLAIGTQYTWLTSLSMAIAVAMQLIPRLMLSIPTWAYSGDMLPCFGVYPLAPKLLLHVGVPSVLYLVVPIIFCILFTRNSFEITYRVLIPHLVCVTWAQLALVFFIDSTAHGLVRAVTVTFTVLLVMPLAAFVACILGVYVLVKVAHAFELLIPLTLWFLFLSVPWVTSRCLSEKVWCAFPRALILLRWFCYLMTLIMVLVFLGSLVSHQHAAVHSPTKPVLSFEAYYNNCHQPAWNEHTQAVVESGCFHLLGANVWWRGTVEGVRITELDNKLESVLSIFPHNARNWLRCQLGTSYKDRKESCEVCPLVQKIMRDECDTSYWTHKSFEVVLSCPSWLDPANIFVTASDHFETFMLGLVRGDEIAVNGTLVANLGGARPMVKAHAVQCVNCAQPLPEISVSSTPGVSQQVLTVAQFVIHFLFSPLIEYQGSPLTLPQ